LPNSHRKRATDTKPQSAQHREERNKVAGKTKTRQPGGARNCSIVVIERMSSRRREKKFEIQNADSQADRGQRDEIVDKTHQQQQQQQERSEEESRGQRRRIYKMFKNHDFCYSLEVAEEESEASL
jgi:hypothetical protein